MAIFACPDWQHSQKTLEGFYLGVLKLSVVVDDSNVWKAADSPRTNTSNTGILDDDGKSSYLHQMKLLISTPNGMA